MPRVTKAELERENAELRDKLLSVYDELGDFLEIDGEDGDSDEEDVEDVEEQDD